MGNINQENVKNNDQRAWSEQHFNLTAPTAATKNEVLGIFIFLNCIVYVTRVKADADK